MTMLERVTQAVMADLREQVGGKPMPGPQPSGGPESWWADGGSIDVARLVFVGIEAMREPTAAMLEAWDIVGIDQDPRDYWNTAIAFILLEAATP